MTEDDEIKLLWQQDNDLSKIEMFFNTLDPTTDEKERIKNLTLIKTKESDPVKKNLVYSLINGKSKYALAIAAIALFTIVGLYNIEPLNNKADSLSISSTLPKSLENRMQVVENEPSNSAAATNNNESNIMLKEAVPTSDETPKIALQAAASPSTNTITRNTRQVIYHEVISIEVNSIEQAFEQINLKSQNLGAEIQNVVQDDKSKLDRSIDNILITIPFHKVDELISILNEIGKIINRQVINVDHSNNEDLSLSKIEISLIRIPK